MFAKLTNGDFPIKNGDLPIKNGDFPLKIVIFLLENGDFPVGREAKLWLSFPPNVGAPPR